MTDSPKKIKNVRQTWIGFYLVEPGVVAVLCVRDCAVRERSRMSSQHLKCHHKDQNNYCVKDREKQIERKHGFHFEEGIDK